MANYLTFVSERWNSSVTINYVSGSNVMYKTKIGETYGSWTSCPSGTTISLPSSGDYVELKGNNVCTSGQTSFSMTGTIGCFGSVTSLTDGDGSDSYVQLTSGCYQGMFAGCTSLIMAPSLPSVNLASHCYRDMFSGCTNLATPPTILPAINVSFDAPYYAMFMGCTSLTYAPLVYANSEYGTYEFQYMFSGCTALTRVDKFLSGGSIGTNSTFNLAYAFKGCTSLNYIYCGIDSVRFNKIGKEWMSNVAANGTFVCKYSMRGVERSVDGVPASWSLVYPITVTLTNDGATVSTIYNKSGTTEYYSNSSLSSRITSVTVPTKSGNIFGGYYIGETQLVDTSGNIQAVQLSANATATASWKSSYVITFNPAPGSGGTTSIYNKLGTSEYYSDSSLTTLISSITIPIREGFAFCGYYNGQTQVIGENGNILVSELNSDITATATWTESNYLTFTAQAANSSVTINYVSGSDVYYVKNGGSWTACPSGTTVTLNSVGDYVRFRGVGIKTNGYNHFSMSGTIAGSGSVTSLTDGNGIDSNVTLADFCYLLMFQNCSSLTTAPTLPAKTMVNSCYYYMFQNCTALTTAPALPAETLAEFCYFGIFMGCTSLTDAPVLSVTTMVKQCYACMFYGCSALTTAPALPAETLVDDCYYAMFCDCSSLNYVSTDQTSFTGCEGWLPLNVLPWVAGEFHCKLALAVQVPSSRTTSTVPPNFTIFPDTNYFAVSLLDEVGGSTVNTIYNKYNTTEYYSDSALTTLITSVTPPTKSGNVFGGYYNGETQIIDATGNIQSGQLSADVTATANWTRVSYTLTLNPEPGSGGTLIAYNKYNTSEYYSDAALTNQITSITLPTLAGNSFAGYYDGQTQIVDGAGTFQSVTLSADTTATASWDQINTLTFDPAPGSGGTLVAYNKNGTTEYYSDASLTTRITTITLPTRDRHAFAGYYNGDTLIVNAAGEFQSVTLAADTTATASWNLTYYELTFSPSPGSGGTETAYNKYGTSEYYSDAALTTRILSITAPTRECYSFAGYSANSTEIVDASGAFQNVTLAADTTATASWTLSSYKLTFDPNYGTGGTTAVYNKLNTAEYYSDFLFANRVTTITPPTREGKTFIGYSVNGTQVVNQAGTIVSGALSGDTTAVASWLNDTIQVMLKNSADGAVVRTIYNKPNTSEYYNESTYTNRIYSVAVPTKECYAFTGYYSGSTQAIAANGDILLGVLADDVVTVADWSLVSYKLDLNATPGTGGTAAIFNKLNTTEYYSDDLVTTRITAISVPTAPDGQYFYEYLVGGLRIVNTDGNIATGIPLSANATATATYRTTAWLYTLDHDGGTGSVNTFYVRDLTKSCYADATLATRIYSVTIPTRTGYTFTGYYDGETQQIDESGAISLTATATGGKTFTARWTANTYTLSFNKSGGSGTANPKSVTTGQAIGNLPTPTKSKHDFDGWFVDNAPISAATVWTWGENKTAVAHWSVASIGVVTDYFGLANTNLVAISSESGDNTKRVCVSHVGRYEPDVTAQSGKWRNPTVTYEVIGNMTFACQLGKAFAGSSGISGYMITSVEIDTKLGEFPRIKVSGTANEGVNAINLFNVSVPLLGRARPQNLLSAVSTSSDGGEIHAAKLTATCDPVVIEEGLMPVASDVVNGRINIDVSSLAINREGEPEANASSGFTKIGASRSAVTTYYTYWQTKFTKEIN